jgi:hypothetical protein
MHMRRVHKGVLLAMGSVAGFAAAFAIGHATRVTTTSSTGTSLHATTRHPRIAALGPAARLPTLQQPSATNTAPSPVTTGGSSNGPTGGQTVTPPPQTAPTNPRPDSSSDDTIG